MALTFQKLHWAKSCDGHEAFVWSKLQILLLEKALPEKVAFLFFR